MKNLVLTNRKGIKFEKIGVLGFCLHQLFIFV